MKKRSSKKQTREVWLSQLQHRIKDRGLSVKMMFVLIVSTTIAIIATAGITIMNSNVILADQNKALASGSIATLELSLNSTEIEELMRAEQLATNYQIITRLKENNITAVKYIFDVKSTKISHIHQAITDHEGTILVSNSPLYPVGENVKAQPLIEAAMKGTADVVLSKTEKLPLAIFAVAPVFDENRTLYGTVINTYDLQYTNILDSLKSSSDADFALFADDTCINTTIARDAKKITGTQLNESLSETVINQKQVYYGEQDIYGVSYTTAYSPLLSQDGKVLGVIFAGKDLTAMKDRMNVSIVMIVAFIVFAVVMVGIMGNSVISKAVRKPLKHMITVMDHIARGEIDMELKNQLKHIQSNDEIRTLSISVNSVINSIYNISEDAAVLKEAALQKNLTVSVDANKYTGIYNDIMFTVNQLFEQLAHVVRDISMISDEISVGATHSASASNNLADGAMKQSKITENLAQSIQSITITSEQNLMTSAKASASMTSAKQSIDESNRHMIEVMNAMSDIEQKSVEISKIARAIDDIAFQTNILALNAAIEAARAGQAGKGFAVVAEEVRNLAIKSAEAANSVGELINKTTEAVEQSTVVTKQTEQSLKQAVMNSDDALRQVDTIKSATQSQYQSIDEISKGMGNISNIVQNNAAIAEETAASSAELEQQSDQLKQLVNEYQVDL